MPRRRGRTMFDNMTPEELAAMTREIETYQPPDEAAMAKFRVDELKTHLGLLPNCQPVSPRPTIWIEKTPSSTRGAECRGCYSNEKIKDGEYRIAVKPGQHSWRPGTSDYYHINCFEEIADFSDLNMLERVSPLTEEDFKYDVPFYKRAMGMATGFFPVDAGAERLVREWKTRVEEVIKKRSLIEAKDRLTLDKEENATSGDKGNHAPEENSSPNPNQALTDLLYKSGSATFQPQKVPDMTDFRFMQLSTQMAPIESDGPDDNEEWNLFKNFIALTSDACNESIRHSLSRMLSWWKICKTIADRDEGRLNDKGKELRGLMGPKGIRAIRRLSGIPAPDFSAPLLPAEPSTGMKRDVPLQQGHSDDGGINKKQKIN